MIVFSLICMSCGICSIDVCVYNFVQCSSLFSPLLSVYVCGCVVGKALCVCLRGKLGGGGVEGWVEGDNYFAN